MNIFVAKLNYKTSSEELHEVFARYGHVNSAKVIMDKMTGRSKGFGFVEMEDDQEALAAIEGLDGSTLQGQQLVVKKANPRRENRDSNRRW